MLLNIWMKSIEEIYQDNIKLLVKEYGGIQGLADTLKKSHSQVSQWKNASKDSKTQRPRTVSKEMAKYIEIACNKPPGWMNTDHQNMHIESSDIDADALIETYGSNEKRREDDQAFNLPQYRDAIGAMGKGVTLKDQPGQITSLRVTSEWLEKNVPSNTGKNNLCVVTGFGDSMKGMYNSGDPLLVDAGIRTCEYDGVYFFRVGNEGFIKRLQRIPGQGILVISENRKYRDWTITEDMDFEIFAKVLKVWQSTDF